MAGKFEITKAGDGTFSFEFLIDGTPVAQSPVFEKEDACRRGVKAVKKNSRMKVQNAFAGIEAFYYHFMCNLFFAIFFYK